MTVTTPTLRKKVNRDFLKLWPWEGKKSIMIFSNRDLDENWEVQFWKPCWERRPGAALQGELVWNCSITITSCCFSRCDSIWRQRNPCSLERYSYTVKWANLSEKENHNCLFSERSRRSKESISAIASITYRHLNSRGSEFFVFNFFLFHKLGFTASPCSSETLQERSVRLKQKYFQIIPMIIPSSGMYEDYKKT